MKPPEECASLAEVRAAIDTLDRELLALLSRRAGYVHAAARFKTDAAEAALATITGAASAVLERGGRRR